MRRDVLVWEGILIFLMRDGNEGVAGVLFDYAPGASKSIDVCRLRGLELPPSLSWNYCESMGVVGGYLALGAVGFC